MARFVNGQGGQYLTASTSAIPSAYPLTIAAWIWIPGGQDLNRDIVTLENAADAYFGMCIDDSQRIMARIRNFAGGGIGTAVATASALQGQWVHATVVFASTTSRSAYLNGGNKGTGSTPTMTLPPIPRVHIGKAVDMTGFQGNIGHVGIWSVVLTDDEILALVRGFSPRVIRPSALVTYWPIGGYTGALPEPDRWRNRVDLTLVGDTNSAYKQGPRVVPVTSAILGAVDPAVPVYRVPTNNATVSLNQALVWKPAMGALTYDVYFGTNNPPPLVSADQAATAYFATVVPGTQYYWRVVAKNAVGPVLGPLATFTLTGAGGGGASTHAYAWA